MMRIKSITDFESTEAESYFDQLTPGTQTFVKRVLGVGVTLYISRVIITSPEFQYAFSRLGIRIPLSCTIIRPLLNLNLDSTGASRLLELPGRVRRKIWLFLPFQDIKNLRQVCKLVRWEIDCVVGVDAQIDFRSPKRFNWFKSVAIRKCRISHMKNLDSWDFLFKPDALTNLEICDVCTISPDVFRIILNKCVNLSQLSVYFRDDVNFKPNSRILYALKEKEKHNFRLSLLHVSYIPAYGTCHWILKFKKSIQRPGTQDIFEVLFKKQTKCKKLNPVQYLHLNFEHYERLEYPKNCSFWKNFFQDQTDLKVLFCNLDSVSWDFYARGIRKNSNTLEKIFIFHVEFSSDQRNPFDWNHFAKCPNLTSLSIYSKKGKSYGPRIYRAMKPVTMGLRVIHCNFGIVYWGFYLSIITANSNTLEDIKLLRLITWDEENQIESPFDWNVFSQCELLKKLNIGGEHLQFLTTVNFESIPTRRMRHFQLYWVALSSENIHHIITYMPKLENTFEFLDWCTIDNTYQSGDSESVAHRIMQERDWSPSLNRLKRILHFLPLTEIIATTWLYFVQSK